MAPIKKTKNAHLADQEPTGIEVPPELIENFETPDVPAKPARKVGRPRISKNEPEHTEENRTEERRPRRNHERKHALPPIKDSEGAQQPAEQSANEQPVNDVVAEPSVQYFTQEAESIQVPAQNGDEHPASPEGFVPQENATEGELPLEVAAEGPQNQKPQQFQNFNKYDKKNRFNKFDRNNRVYPNRNPPEEPEDAIPLPEPDSEAWNKVRDCWLKYRKMTMSELQELASQKENLDYRRYRKQSLGLLLQGLENENNVIYAEGVLDIPTQNPNQNQNQYQNQNSNGPGYLRYTEFNYNEGPEDVYVSQNLIRRLGLKKGDIVGGFVRPPRNENDRYAMRRIDRINFEDPEKIKHRVGFEYLTPIHPNEKIRLEYDPEEMTTRVMDLFSPIGKGQRSIILAPPRTGKTILLQNMTRAIATNHPECIIMVLLIDERPEEVTEMREIVAKLVEKNPALRAEVVASTFDEPPAHHTHVANMVLEKAKRLVELQHDVVVLLDSITRFARANNVDIPHSGKILSGGVDANAMQFPKKFFGAARKIADKMGDFQRDSNGQIVHTLSGEPVREIAQKNGSLTIIGTALIETGSRMDEVIFEEFKGTGNMELVLDRRLAERRTWPAIDIFKSGTRKEDRLLTLREQDIIWSVRQGLQNDTENGIMDKVIKWMKQYKTNAELLEFLRKAKDSARVN